MDQELTNVPHVNLEDIYIHRTVLLHVLLVLMEIQDTEFVEDVMDIVKHVMDQNIAIVINVDKDII